MKQTTRLARRRAREYAIQAIYSWQLSQNNIVDIEQYFLKQQDLEDVDISYFHELILGVAANKNHLDYLIRSYMFCLFNKLGQIEKAVLRVALFELSKCRSIPYKVIINEAIELVKIFGAEDHYKLINGVLDRAASKIRHNRK